MTQRHAPVCGDPHTPSSAEESRAPLLWSQEPYWYQYHLPFPVVDSAKIPLTVRLPGRGVPEGSIPGAVRRLMLRHEALRTVCPTDRSGVPYQSILAEFDTPAPFRRDGDEPEDVEAVFRALFDPPMDQAADLPLRVGYTVVGQRARTLVLLLNHMAADGMSLPVLRADLEGYLGLPPSGGATASTAGRGTESPQPAEVAREQDSGAWDARSGRALRYCEDVLSAAPAAQFPGFRSTAGKGPHAEAGSHYLRFSLHSSRLLSALRKMHGDAGPSVSVRVSALFAVAVAVLSGNPRTVFKTNFSNRFRGLERSVGCFFQEALVCVNPAPDTAIGELVAETENRTLAGARHARYPYLRFRDLKARVEARRGHAIRLGTLVNFSSRFEKVLEGPGTPARPTRVEERECLWRDEYTDLSLRSYPSDGEAVLDLIAHRTVIEQRRIGSLLAGMEEFLVAWADQPDLARVTVSEAAERFGLPTARYGEGWARVGPSWVNTAELTRLIRTVEGVEAASVGVVDRAAGERVLVARLVGRPSLQTEVRNRVLSALREDVDLVCPHEFVWQDELPDPGPPPPAAEPRAVAVDRRGSDRGAADRALTKALSVALGDTPVDLDLPYARQGGTAVLAPAVVRRLALLGYAGPTPDDLLGPWPLRVAAALCVPHRECAHRECSDRECADR
ncbi:condensation domain-containing protein [Streptomyces phytohabitans]|uniref:condensation domain-containing protein n=1 Tax=Streptomyces phytohabitans TaxID=1150371 RepID=UPI00345BD3C0